MAIQPILVEAWNAVTVPMQTASTALIGALQGWTMGWFVKVVPAYLVAMLLIAAWSAEETAVLRFWRHVLLAATVYTFISTLGTYNYYVTGVVNGTMNGLTAAVTGAFGAAQSPPQAFNSLAVKTFDVGNAVYKAVPTASYVAGLGLMVAIAIYWTLVQIVLWFVFVLYLCSYILTNYVLGYGSIFIAMFFFEPTRQFFDGWFRAVIAGILAQTFLVGDLALMTTVLTGLLHVVGAEINPTGADAATGDIGFMVWDMFGVLGLMVLFVVIALLSVYLAVAISNGAHAQLVRMPSLSGRVAAPAGGSGQPGPSGSPGHSAASVSSVSPGGGQRAYPFQKSVGSAP